MQQYYVLTRSQYYVPILQWIIDRELGYELHLNRTRFWIDPDSPVGLEFGLRWLDHCDLVSHTETETFYLPR